MDIRYSLYSLKRSETEGERQGALLRFTFEDGKVGYADCHPWPERGDLPLSDQLAALRSAQEDTPLLVCARHHARQDAEARDHGYPLSDATHSLRNHRLMPPLFACRKEMISSLIAEGYTHVKIKLTPPIEKAVDYLFHLFANTPLRLRLDCNEQCSFHTLRMLLKRLNPLQDQIDWIEDPSPYHPEEWRRVQQEGWTLACDQQMSLAVGHPECAAVLILKPAIHLPPAPGWAPTQRCIVTSYLDHPLGQVAAAYVATQLDPEGKELHGLLSHHLYLPTPFSQHLSWTGCHFRFPSGNGWGFEQELQAIQWQAL